MPFGGDGVFVKKEFLTGEIVCEYRGFLIDTKYDEHQILAYEDKLISINEKYSIIGRNIGSKVNDLVKFDLENFT